MNNLHVLILSQKLPMQGFIKNHNDDTDTRYPFGLDVQYPQKLHGTHNDLPFSPERRKIRKGEKVVGNFHDRKEYVVHIRTLKKP